MNYLYAKLNKQVEDVKYKGVNTPTINMEVDSSKKEISANVRMDTAISSSSTRPVSGRTVKSYVDSRVTVPAPSTSYSELLTKLKIGGTTYMLPAGDSVGFEGSTVVIDTPDTEPAQEIHDIVVTLVLTQNFELIRYIVTDKTANRELTYDEFTQIVGQRNPQQASHISFEIYHVDFTSYITADSLSYTPFCTISGEGVEVAWGNAIDRRIMFAFGPYNDTANIGIYSRDAFPTTYRPWSLQVDASVSWISTGEMSIEADPQATQLPREVPFATSILTLPSSLVLVYDDDTYVMELHNSGNPLDWYYTVDGVGVTVTRDAIMIPDKEAHTVDFKAQTSEFETDSLTIRCDNAFSTSNGYIKYFDANGKTVTQQLSATVNDISGVMGLKSPSGADGYIWVEIGCDNGAQLLSSSSYESYKIDGENAWLCCFPVSGNVADITLLTTVIPQSDSTVTVNLTNPVHPSGFQSVEVRALLSAAPVGIGDTLGTITSPTGSATVSVPHSAEGIALILRGNAVYFQYDPYSSYYGVNCTGGVSLITANWATNGNTGSGSMFFGVSGDGTLTLDHIDYDY